MNTQELDHITYRLSRAGESLEEARVLLSMHHLFGAVNRLYYACFYAAWALLLTEGHSSRKHSGIRSLFDMHWVNTGRVPAHCGRVYRQLFERRQRSDYVELAEFEQTEVETLLASAEEFVKTVSEKAREKMAGDSA